jgi:hypothetical protein
MVPNMIVSVRGGEYVPIYSCIVIRTFGDLKMCFMHLVGRLELNHFQAH